MTDLHDYSAWFGPFAELIKGLVEPLESLVIASPQGRVRWRYDYTERGANWCPETGESCAPATAPSVRSVGAGFTGVVVTIKRADGELDDVLYAVLDDGAPTHLLEALLGGLAPIIARHSTLDLELVTMTDELVRRYEELTLVYDNEEGLGSVEENERFLSHIIDNCTESLDVCVTALLLRDRERSVVRFGVESEDGVRIEGWLKNPAMGRWLETLKAPVVLNEQAESWQHGLSLECPLKMIACPLMDGQNNRYGTLLVARSDTKRDFENSDRNILVMLAEKATRIVSVKYDALTGLLTREGFERCVNIALRDAASQQRRSTVLHLNMDQFKLVNDTFGHDVGDDLLQRVAKGLAGGLRTKDRFARVGGDEFGVLLPDSSLDEAVEIAERMCAVAVNTPCKVGTRQLDVGISIGVVQISP
ncbi:MAG: GGDEF domain-containing protein, partial [Gammaproteobacteria bacterium]